MCVRSAKIADQAHVRRDRRAGDWFHRDTGESRASSAESSGQGWNWRAGDRFEFWRNRALEVDQDAAAFRRASDACISVEFLWRSRVGVESSDATYRNR